MFEPGISTFAFSQANDGHASLDILFSQEYLRTAFITKIEPTQLRGIDRLSPAQVSRNLDEQIAIIQAKCSNGTFKFSPYLESLRLKTRDKPPRLLSIATVRDRLVLYVLKELLHKVFDDCVARKLPNQYIRDIGVFYQKNEKFSVIKADIKSFYDELDHERLFKILSSRLPENILKLVIKAVRNPTVPIIQRTAFARSLRKVSKGVPQGLAISNILAEIYMHEIEKEINQITPYYIRYVDDILLFSEAGLEKRCYAELKKILSKVQLATTEDKHVIATSGNSFEYLGYEIEYPRISVKRSTTQKFIDSLAANFADYKYVSGSRYRSTGVDSDEARQRLFLDVLNERITGAINENRRYGWIFYFLEINDKKQLYQIDTIIKRLWQRFIKTKPSGSLKRLIRAYHEAKYNQLGGYIHNYNRYDSPQSKLEFLARRGIIDPKLEIKYSEDQIEQMFLRARYASLSQLDADVGTIS